MRANLVQPHEAAPQPDALQREGLRLFGALTALLAAALVLAGGLLWREHARSHPHAQPAAITNAAR